MTEVNGGAQAVMRRFAYYVLCGLGCAVLYHAVLRWAGFEWPWNTFLFQPADRYNDWIHSVLLAASGDPYFFRGTPTLANYFPGAYLLFGIAGNWSTALGLIFYVGVGVGILMLAIFAMCRLPNPASWHQRNATGAPVVLFLAIGGSYPVLFAIDRGNLDLWIAGFCTLFVATQNTRFALAGWAALALAIAAKGYPAAFLLLLVARREFRSMASCVAGVCAVSWIGLETFHGNLAENLAGLRVNLDLFYERYVLGDASLFGSSDPYNAARFAVWLLDPMRPVEAVSAEVLTVFAPISALYLIISVYFVLAVAAAPWRRVMATCLIAVLFPSVANDYKLCCLIPGVLALLMSRVSGRREVIAFWLLILIMIPKSYWFIRGHPISMFINPLLLIGIAYQVLADHVAWRRSLRMLPFRLRWYVAPSADSRHHASLMLY